MFSIPFALALVPYAVILIVFLAFAAIDVYHLIAYGATTRVSYAVTVVFCAVTVLILIATAVLLRDVDWSQSFTVSLPFVGAGAAPSI